LINNNRTVRVILSVDILLVFRGHISILCEVLIPNVLFYIHEATLVIVLLIDVVSSVNENVVFVVVFGQVLSYYCPFTLPIIIIIIALLDSLLKVGLHGRDSAIIGNSFTVACFCFSDNNAIFDLFFNLDGVNFGNVATIDLLLHFSLCHANNILLAIVMLLNSGVDDSNNLTSLGVNDVGGGLDLHSSQFAVGINFNLILLHDNWGLLASGKLLLSLLFGVNWSRIGWVKDGHDNLRVNVRGQLNDNWLILNHSDGWALGVNLW